jgi:Tfp pilus assembly protein PilN
MPQQINLCTPILLTQKRYFSANTMAAALAIFLVLGGVLCGVWVWNLDQASESLKQSLAAHAHEVESLQAAIQRSRTNAAPVDPALMAQLEERRAAITQRIKLQEALKDGMFRPGLGHSDRLTWVARSIPAPVWITEIRMDGARFDVSGFTLEPGALNDWVAKLSVSPLMQGLKLATVKVENATAATVTVPSAAASDASTPISPPRAVWSFNLVSIEPAAMGAKLASSAPGTKP